MALDILGLGLEILELDILGMTLPVNTSPVGLALPAMSVQGILEPSLQQRPCSSLRSHKLAPHIHLSQTTDWWSTFTSFIITLLCSYHVMSDLAPAKTLILVFVHHLMSVDVPPKLHVPKRNAGIFISFVSAIPQKLQQRHTNPWYIKIY